MKKFTLSASNIGIEGLIQRGNAKVIETIFTKFSNLGAGTKKWPFNVVFFLKKK